MKAFLATMPLAFALSGCTQPAVIDHNEARYSVTYSDDNGDEYQSGYRVLHVRDKKTGKHYIGVSDHTLVEVAE